MPKRDFQIQFWGAIAPNENNVPLIGQKDIEVFHTAFQYDARELPVKESDVQKTFSTAYNLLIKKMRSAGLVQ